jgi:hypothetical protein
LKNTTDHQITTIGAGIPEFQTASSKFTYKIGIKRLLLSLRHMLVNEGIVGYFTRNASTASFAEIDRLLEYIWLYVCGHIYPLMWVAERLVPKIRDQGKLAN